MPKTGCKTVREADTYRASKRNTLRAGGKLNWWRFRSDTHIKFRPYVSRGWPYHKLGGRMQRNFARAGWWAWQ